MIKRVESSLPQTAWAQAGGLGWRELGLGLGAGEKPGEWAPPSPLGVSGLHVGVMEQCLPCPWDWAPGAAALV